MVHASAIAEPLMVLAAGRYRDRRDEYLRTAMLGQLGVALAAGALVAAVAAVAGWLGGGTLARSFAGLALAAPAMLTLLALRRVAYARFEPRLATWAGAVHLTLVLAGLTALHLAGRLGVVSAFAVLAAASAVVGVALWRATGLRNPFRRPWPLAAEVATEHRRYGRWGAPSGALSWIPGNLYYVVLPLLPGAAFGLQATAALRALVNLIMPVLQANAAVGTALIPALAARRRAGKRSGVAAPAAALIGASALFWLALVVAGGPLVDWLYGGRYHADRGLLALLGLIPVLTAATHLLRGLLLSRERPDQLFWAYLVAAVATVGGLPLVLAFGLPGVLAAMALGPAAQAAAMLAMARARRRTDPSPGR
jgi:O-antigen/teichoic acid export membrane protein